MDHNSKSLFSSESLFLLYILCPQYWWIQRANKTNIVAFISVLDINDINTSLHEVFYEVF